MNVVESARLEETEEDFTAIICILPIYIISMFGLLNLYLQFDAKTRPY